MATYTVDRSATRQQVYDRDGGRCIWPTCRQPVILNCDSPFLVANIHELRSRSLGGDPTNPDGCVTTCWRCHMQLHPQVGGKKKRIDGTVVSAGLRFFERTHDTWNEVTV